jgi:hypothetical protein
LCSSGFTTKSVRPPTSYTNKLKNLEIGDYELDHLISLEIGGNPVDPKNLWLQPWERRGARFLPAGEGAESKDVIENRLHRSERFGSDTAVSLCR